MEKLLLKMMPRIPDLIKKAVLYQDPTALATLAVLGVCVLGTAIVDYTKQSN